MDNDLEAAFSHISNKIRINPDDGIDQMCKKMKQRVRLLQNLKLQLSQRMEESMIKINDVMAEYSNEQTKQIELRRSIKTLQGSQVRDLQDPQQVEEFHRASKLTDVDLIDKQQRLTQIYDELREETDKMHRTQLKLQQLKNRTSSNFQGLQLSIDTLKIQLRRNNSDEFVQQLRTVLSIALNQEKTLNKLKKANQAKLDHIRLVVLQIADLLRYQGVSYKVRDKLGLKQVEDMIIEELDEIDSDVSDEEQRKLMKKKKQALIKMQKNLYEYKNYDVENGSEQSQLRQSDSEELKVVQAGPKRKGLYYQDYSKTQKSQINDQNFIKTRKIKTPKKNKSMNNTKSQILDVYDNQWIKKTQLNKKQEKSVQSNIKQKQKIMKQDTFDNEGNIALEEHVKANVDSYYQRPDTRVDANPKSIIKSKLTKSQLNVAKRSKSNKQFDEHIIKSKSTKNVVRQDISTEKPVRDKYFDNVLKNVTRAKSRQEKSEQEYLKMKPIDRHERLKLDTAVNKLGRMNCEYDQLRQQAHEYVNQNKKAQAKETYERAYKKLHQMKRLEAMIQSINRNLKELR